MLEKIRKLLGAEIDYNPYTNTFGDELVQMIIFIFKWTVVLYLVSTFAYAFMLSFGSVWVTDTLPKLCQQLK